MSKIHPSFRSSTRAPVDRTPPVLPGAIDGERCRDALAVVTSAAIAVTLLLATAFAWAAESAAPAAAGASTDIAGLFARECAVCHGEKGAGDGPAAALFDPKPRDLTSGLYKLRSTPTGELPTDADLTRTITQGIPGTGMPSFRHLGDGTAAEVVAFVKTLGGPPNEEGSWFDIYKVPPPEVVPPSPALDEATIARGRDLFTKMGCEGCHGKTGKGDGKKPEELLDHKGNPVHPRNFTLGVFKGGNRGEDLYMRVLTGLDGTPMTGFWKDVMTPEERWSVVSFVQSLGTPRTVEQPSRGTVALGGGPPPQKIADAAWTEVPESRLDRMALAGGWLLPFEPLTVRAAAGDGRAALLVSWDDGPDSCTKLRVSLPQGGRAPTFAVGSTQAPLRVWQWEAASGARALEVTGVGAERVLDEKLTLDEVTHGSKRSVLVGGRLPDGAEQVLVSVAGCTPGGSYLTASTFYDLGTDAAATR